MSIDLLDHFVHGATALIILIFFFKRWSFLLFHVRKCYRIIINIIRLTFMADLMTFCMYLLINYFSFSIPLVMGFIITSLLLLSLYVLPQRTPFFVQRFTVDKALVLGLVQGCALLPGISRFASTYVCARWMGISSYKSFEISWLILWPLLIAAFVHSTVVMYVTNIESLMLCPSILFVMMLASIVSLSALRYVAYLAYQEKWWWFGVYMFVPIVLACFM